MEVCYHIGLVHRLPEDFVIWLKRQEKPEVLRVFTERRLRRITRLENEIDQQRHLSALYSRLHARKPNMSNMVALYT